MTLAQIYDAVVNLVYGDVIASPVPVAEVPFIQTLVLQKHREVQQNYNFWFNQARTDLNIISGITIYPLPADYKELINLEYEGRAELIGNDLILTDEPLENKTVRFDLWRFLPAPPLWNPAHSDAVTQYCSMAIVYMVTAIVMLKRDEKSAAASYIELASQALESVYAEDYRRRQSPGAIF
ncbi:MAG: hypothetical protein CVV49_00575 [Spirochaetae bacterium HGW-Spirochaetae-5]|nr:MAG: hypothetical protein CVV49_00575 [Spirochaetae bacterium HGW-Spirochaetae-5]